MDCTVYEVQSKHVAIFPTPPRSFLYAESDVEMFHVDSTFFEYIDMTQNVQIFLCQLHLQFFCHYGYFDLIHKLCSYDICCCVYVSSFDANHVASCIGRYSRKEGEKTRHFRSLPAFFHLQMQGLSIGYYCSMKLCNYTQHVVIFVDIVQTRPLRASPTDGEDEIIEYML